MSKKVVSLLLSMLMLMSLCVITLPVSAAGAIGTTITFDEDPALVVGTDYLVSAGVESGTTTDPVKGSGNVFYMKKTASGNPSITPYQTSATKGKQSNIEIYFDFMIPAADSNLFMELGGYHTDKSGRGTGAIFQKRLISGAAAVKVA